MQINPNQVESDSKAKILVVSDSHGSKFTLEAIIRKFGTLCDAICFCGDGIQDLVDIIEESYFDQELKSCIPQDIFLVQGNGDGDIYRYNYGNLNTIRIPMNKNFSICGINIFMSHGHEYDVYYGMDFLYDASIVRNADLVFFGHTHLANVQTKYGITLLNPGSCARPRGGMPHTFAIISVEKETKKIEYNYYEIKMDESKKLTFNLFSPPIGELPLLW